MPGFANSKNKKPGTRPGFFGELKTAENRYPARDERQIGRRARDVIPAAMRAEVRMSALAWIASMGAKSCTDIAAAQDNLRTLKNEKVPLDKRSVIESTRVGGQSAAIRWRSA
ncbi:MAG: hypothetical protein ABI365_10535, partial [Lysobacteraceae bacterium]